MSEATKAVVRRVFDDVINGGALDVAEVLTTPAAIAHVPFADPGRGSAALKGIAASLRAGFPDLRVEIEDLFDAGDRVVVRWRTVRQTHLGRYRGIPPTGREIRLTAIQVFRFEGERIAEFWLEMDQLAAARQMGVVPPEDAGAPRRAALVLGSLVRFAVLEVKDGLGRRRDARPGQAS